MSLWQILGRTLRLPLPTLRSGKVVRGLDPYAARVRNMRIEIRARAGYFLGSIYFNYGVTAFFVTIAALG